MKRSKENKRERDEALPRHHRQRAGLRPDERDPSEPPGPPGSGAGDPFAAGEAGGGSAAGGLAGTNAGDGEVDDDDLEELEEAFGNGIFDDAGSNADGGPPYAGPSGGAVGGTPAEKRSKGGHTHRGIEPS